MAQPEASVARPFASNETTEPSLRAAVTVVVPMYNATSTIERALRSIAQQSLPPQAIVVVDDASSDGSAGIVEEMSLPGVEVVRLPVNGGAARARNEGVRRANTPWVAFLDADDVWDPGFLRAVTDAAQQLRADFASSGGLRHTHLGETVTRLLNEPTTAQDHTRDFWRIALKFMPAHPSSTIVKRELFEKLGGFPDDIRSGEDWVLWARLWLNGRYAFVNQPLSTWLQLESGLTAAGRTAADEVDTFRALAAVLRRAIRARRPGTRWFVIWYARTLVRRGVRATLGGVRRRWRSAARRPAV